jgi:hypothetical protein
VPFILRVHMPTEWQTVNLTYFIWIQMQQFGCFFVVMTVTHSFAV